MKTLDDDKLTIDNVIEYLNKCLIVASRSNRSGDFVLYSTIMIWLNELKHRREEDTYHSRECTLKNLDFILAIIETGSER